MEQNRTPAEPAKLSNTESATLVLFGRIVAFAISVSLPLVLVWQMPQAEFGLYKQVFLVVNTAINIVPLGFASNIYYFLPRERERRGAVICNTAVVLVSVGLLTATALARWPGLMKLVSKEPEILPLAPLIGLTILGWILAGLVEVVPVALQEMRLAMMVSVGNQILRTSSFMIAAVTVGTIRSLIWGAIVYAVVAIAALFYYLELRFPRFWRSFQPKLLRQQLSYALPLGMMGLIWYFQSDLHNYFVSHQFGAAQFAIYSTGCFQLPLVQLMLEAGSSVLISQIAVLQEAGDTDRILFLSLRAMRKMAAVLFPSYAFLLVMSHEFLAFLFPPQYAASWPIFVVNLTIIPMSVLLFDPVVRAFADYRYLFVKLKLAMFVVLLVALWWATPHIGMVGAIGSVVLVIAVDRLSQALVFARILHFGRRHLPLLSDTGKLAISAAVAAVVAAGSRLLMTGFRPFWILLVCGILYVAVYGALVRWFKIMEQDETSVLKRAALSPWTAIRRRA